MKLVWKTAVRNFILPLVAVTMSSREIAELVEKRHDNVKRTIDTLAEKGVISFPQIEERPDTGGRPGVDYRIGKRDSFIIVAQLCPEFTARIVDRWQELESVAAKPQHVIPQTLTEALRLAADLADARDQQAAEKVVASKPPVVAQVVSPGVVTMSSLELVDFINGQRGEGEAELRHDHFMAKVPKVLGEKDAPNFRGIYQDAYGREKPCFNFPKREACLMAMTTCLQLFPLDTRTA